MTYHKFCKKKKTKKWAVLLSVLYLVYSNLFSMHEENYRTDVSKHVSLNTQIVHNGLFKCSKYMYTIS